MSSIRELALARAIGGGGGGGEISVQSLSVTENGRYTAPSGKAYTPVNVNVPQISVESLSVTENGTYTAPGGKAYSPVNVNVPNTYTASDEGKVVSNGALVEQGSDTVSENGTMDTTLISSLLVNVPGGGGGVVLSGTSAPAADVGNNEDLYIQYSGHQGWDYLYGIDAIYRKVNGSWVEYVDPVDPNSAVHVWTQSTGGTDASMNVQKATYDPDTGVYTPVGDVDVVLYRTLIDGDKYDLNRLATLSYTGSAGASWRIYASAQITDGSQTYATGDLVASWPYSTNKDIYIRRS